VLAVSGNQPLPAVNPAPGRLSDSYAGSRRGARTNLGRGCVPRNTCQ
jgi:hypothetical protein